MQGKKKVLVVLHHALYVRNFIASGFLEKLAAVAEVTALVDPKSLDFIPADQKFKMLPISQVLRFPRWKSDLREKFREMSLVKRSAITTTYQQKREDLQASLLGRLRVFIYELLAKVCDLENLARSLEQMLLPVPRACLDFLRAGGFQEVLYVSSIHDDKMILDLLKAARQLKIPSTNFISSWDNLTTKGCFLLPPTRIFVWGEQDLEKARVEHGFPESRVHVTGAPQFDHYFHAGVARDRVKFLEQRGLDPSKKLILFAGTTLNKVADEPALVLRLQDLIRTGEIPNAQIWYRPHPRSRRHRMEDLRKHPEIFIDDQILGMPDDLSYAVAKEDLQHYPHLLHATDVVVTLWSTMMVEGALYGKPTVVAGFSLQAGANHIAAQFNRWVHLKMVLAWPFIKTTHSMEELTHWTKQYLAMDPLECVPALQAKAGTVINNIHTPSHEAMIRALVSNNASRGVDFTEASC